MKRSYFCVVMFGLALVGCSSQVAENNPDTSAIVANPASSAEIVASPTDVVSQFLDLVRRGGEDSGANELLTKRAQSELRRIGRTVQPIGSPDAGFKVTRAETVPGEEASSLVHSIWSEPTEPGKTDDFQVVWALQREADGWRISGLAMEIEPGKDPMIIDFENGQRMASLLAEPENASDSAKASAPPPAQAQAADPSISR